MKDIKEQVNALIANAVNATRPDDAMRFSQAALNAAHAAQVLATIKSEGER